MSRAPACPHSTLLLSILTKKSGSLGKSVGFISPDVEKYAVGEQVLYLAIDNG